MNRYKNIIMTSFYARNADNDKRNYPHLEDKLVSQMNNQSKIQQQILQQEIHLNLTSEDYLLRFYLSCLAQCKNIKKALLFFLLARASRQRRNNQSIQQGQEQFVIANQQQRRQLLREYEIISKISASSSKLYEQLIQNKVKNWEIYVLLAQLTLSECYIQDSIQSLHKAIELNKKCTYAFIDLAFIYSFLMQRQYALIYLKGLRDLKVDNKYFCEREVFILYLIEQYQQCLQKIDKCSHSDCSLQSKVLSQNNDLKNIQRSLQKMDAPNIPYKDHLDIAVSTIKQFKQILPENYHTYYSILKCFLVLKTQVKVQIFFLLFNNQSSIRENIFKADLLYIFKDYQSSKELYRMIQEQIKSKSQDIIIKNIFQIRTKNNRLLMQEICYRVYYMIAFTEIQDHQEVMDYCKKALQISNKNKLAQLKKDDELNTISAIYYEMNDNKQKALQFCQKVAEFRRFQIPQCLASAAAIYFNCSKYSQSLNLAQLSIKMGIVTHKIQYIHCMSSYQLGSVEYAMSILTQLISVYPSYKLYHKGMGQIYLGLGRSEDALNSFQKSLQLNELYQQTRFEYLNFKRSTFHCMGLVYIKLGNPEKAIQYLVQSIKLNSIQSVSTLGRIYAQLQRFSEQKKLYQSILPICKQQKYYQIIAQRLGCAYAYQGSFDLALKCFQQQNFKISIDVPYFGKALTYKIKKQYEKAAQYCCKALQINQQIPNRFQIIGQIYQQSNNEQLKNAIIQFIEPMEFKYLPNNMMFAGLNIFWRFVGNIELSLRYFEKYLSPFLNHYQIHKCLSFQLTKQMSYTLMEYYSGFNSNPSASFIFERFLLYKLLDKDKQSKEQLSRYLSIYPAWQISLVKLFTFIQNSFKQKSIISGYYIKQLFKLNQIVGIYAMRICIQKNILGTEVCKMYIVQVLRQKLVKIQKTTLFLESVLIKMANKSELSYIRQDQQTQVQKNIKPILAFYSSIKQCSQSHTIQLQSLIKKLPSMIKRVHVKKTPLFSTVFQKIKKQDAILTRKISENTNEGFLIKTKEILQLFLSERYLKNQLIKYIYKETNLLYRQLDQSIQNEMIKLLTNFKAKRQITFDKILKSLVSTIFNEKSDCQSQAFAFSTDFAKQQQIQYSYYSQQNSKVSLNCNSREQSIKKSQDKPQNAQQQQKRQYKFENLKFLPKQHKQLIFYPQQTFLNKNEFFSKVQIKNMLIYMIFKNVFDLMRQLSQLGPQYIAHYTFYDEWSEQVVESKSFYYSMDEGEPIYKYHQQLLNESLMKQCILKSNTIIDRIVINGLELQLEEIKVIDYLWREGPLEIIKFTLCLIQGIRELEDLCIIHLDLQPKNIIKVGEVYKIMDFDNSFRYNTQKDKYYKSFKNLQIIISLILLSQKKEQQYFISYVFRDIEKQQMEKLLILCNKSNKYQGQGAKKMIIQQLEKYAHRYHLKQFKRIMAFLTVENIMGNFYIQFRHYLNLYCTGKIKYQKIVQKLNCLSNKK